MGTVVGDTYIRLLCPYDSVSRIAARTGFGEFLEATVAATREEFSVARALQGTGLGPGGAVVDQLRRNAASLERQLVEPELARYRQQATDQFDIVLEYAVSDRPIDEFESELLASDSYVDAIAPATTTKTYDAIVADILDRNRRLGDGIEPIVDRPEDDFWAAARSVFSRSEALELVEEAFPFTGPISRHREAFVFEVRIDPSDIVGGILGAGLPTVSLEYTDEVIRATRRAERRIITETKGEVRDRFEASSVGRGL